MAQNEPRLVNPFAAMSDWFTVRRGKPQLPVAPPPQTQGVPASSVFDDMGPKMGPAAPIQRGPTPNDVPHSLMRTLGGLFTVHGGEQPQVAGQGPRPLPGAFGAQAQPQQPQAPDYFSRIVRIEGGTDAKGNFLRSSAGAWGPSQLMPGTAPEAMELAGYDRNDQRWKNDASVNLAAGKAYYEKQLRDFGDPVLAAAAYNAGPGRVRSALKQGGPQGWQQFIPDETKDYVRKFAQGQEPGGVMMPGFEGSFDPQYWNQALGAVNQAEQAALTPFSVTVQQAPPPAFPDAPEMPVRDFTATDERMAAMKPVLDLDRDRPRIERANLFAGLAKGLASTPDGAGLGAVLGNIGAGLLSGRAAADSELQKRIDDFDDKMLQWQRADFAYETGKSESKYQEAVKSVGMLYQHNLAKFSADTQQFNKDNDVQMVGGNFVVRSRTDAGLNVRTIPIAPIIRSQSALQRGQVLGQMAGAEQQSQSMVASAQNQILAGMFSSEYALSKQSQMQGAAGGGDAGVTAFLANPILQATEIYDKGFAPSIFGQETYSQAVAEAQVQAKAEGLLPMTEEFNTRVKDYTVGQLSLGLMQSKPLRDRMMQMAPQLYQNWMMENSRTTTTQGRDARGRTTTQQRTTISAD